MLSYIFLTSRRLVRSAAVLLALASPGLAVDPPQAADLVAALQPAVVNLAITRHTKAGIIGNIAGQSAVTERRIQGSGFLMDPAGIIVTNRHTVTDASDIIVTLHDATRLRAHVLAVAMHSDIALLMVHAGKPLPVLHFGDSSALRPGDSVLVVGNPLGFGSTVTSGIVSALDRVTPESEAGSFFQIDAPLNTGNSGGPVFNLAGEVVGISTAFLTAGSEGGSVGLGLAIPSDEARLIITRLQTSGRDLLGSIGVRVQPVTEDIAAAVGLPAQTAPIITRADANGPAAQAGLRSGDILLTIDDRTIASPQAINRALAASPIGNVIQLGIWRDGKRRTVPVVISALPDGEPAPAKEVAQAARSNRDSLGLILAPLTHDARARLGMAQDETGVLVEDVQIDSLAWDRGIVAGSAIVKLNQCSVTSPADAQQCIDDARLVSRASILLLVQDADGLRWLAVPLQRG